jgi:hypothetical protein
VPGWPNDSWEPVGGSWGRGSCRFDSAAVDAGRQELERWLAATSTHQLGLGAVERECEQRGRELVRLALQAHVDARGDGDVGTAVQVRTPEGLLRYGRKRTHTRRHVTLVRQQEWGNAT